MYAEVLRQLGLMIQRAELLKHARIWDMDREENLGEFLAAVGSKYSIDRGSSLAMVSLCKACGRKAHPRDSKCRAVKTIGGTLEPRCTVCTLPVKSKLFFPNGTDRL